MLISVCLCTWNRAELLDRTLAEMRRLRIPEGVEWEVLVVNNACTDHTDEVLARHDGRLPLRRLFEPKQGHSHARNCAAAAASGELVLWTDDDVLVDSEWLAEYVAAAERWPEAQFFGGTIEPWFEAEPPAWIRRNLAQLSGPLVINRRGDAVRPLAEGERVNGANMGFRREVFDDARFNVSLGRVADALISGDETEFFDRLMSRGASGIWVGSARVRHFIPRSRLTRAYIAAWFHGYGATHARLDGPYLGPHLIGSPRWAVRALLQALPGDWAFRISQGRRGFSSFLAARTMRGYIEESRKSRAAASAGGLR